MQFLSAESRIELQQAQYQSSVNYANRGRGGFHGRGGRSGGRGDFGSHGSFSRGYGSRSEQGGSSGEKPICLSLQERGPCGSTLLEEV